tara:strand:- start:178 stop:744 length:567 start_codon:yes stop_codon:yes gene_type:complete
MEKCVIDQFNKTLLCSNSDIDAMISQLAETIIKEYNDFTDVIIVGVLSNGAPIAERLAKLISIKKDIQLPVGFLDVAVYRDDIESLGQYVTLKESNLPVDIHNMRVILVDDVIHHGRTARAALNALFDFGRPLDVAYSVLIDRGERCLPIKPNFVGRTISISSSQYVAVNLLEVDGEDAIYLVSANEI